MSACRNKVSTVSVTGPDCVLGSSVAGVGTARRRTSIWALASGCRGRFRDGPRVGEASGGGGCLLLLGRASVGRSLG